MSNHTKLVDNANFHIWTDALHARELARNAADAWNRGTYVRWTVTSAWTAFEMASEDAMDTDSLRPDFWRGLDKAVADKRLSKLDRSSGIWSSVAILHQQRREYTHPALAQRALFASAREAEDAIRILRDAIRAIYAHAGKASPKWVEADRDMGWPTGSVGHPVVRHVGATEDAPDQVRVAYVYQGHEYVTDVLPGGSNWAPVVDQLIAEVKVPIAKVLVYAGSAIVFSQDLPMRGSY